MRPKTPRLRAAALLTALLLTVCAANARAQNLTFKPYHANRIYAPGEKVGWKVAVARGEKAAAGPYSYTIKRDGQAVLATGSLDMKSGKRTIETTLADPGMVLVEVRPPAGTTGFHGASKAEVNRVLLGAAVAPTQIKPSEPRPADFDSFWTARIAQLQAVPMDAQLTPGGETLLEPCPESLEPIVQAGQLPDGHSQILGHSFHDFVAFRMNGAGIQWVFASTDSEESCSLLEGLRTQARHI